MCYLVISIYLSMSIPLDIYISMCLYTEEEVCPQFVPKQGGEVCAGGVLVSWLKVKIKVTIKYLANWDIPS